MTTVDLDAAKRQELLEKGGQLIDQTAKDIGSLDEKGSLRSATYVEAKNAIRRNGLRELVRKIMGKTPSGLEGGQTIR